jgi:hypothetical protein
MAELRINLNLNRRFNMATTIKITISQALKQSDFINLLLVEKLKKLNFLF